MSQVVYRPISQSRERTKVNLSYILSLESIESGTQFITAFPMFLRGFKQLSQVTVEIPLLEGYIDGSRRSQMMNEVMQRVQEKVGVRGQYVKTGYRWWGYTRVEEWIWTAGTGQTMDWS